MAAPVLVIGSTGQIGRFLLARTASRPVVALARRPGAIAGHDNVNPIACDLAEALPGSTADWPERAVATVPVWLLPDHADALADRGVRRLVCFSTTSIAGKAGTRNAHERAVVERVARAEARLEEQATARGIGLTILRPTLIYGAGTDKTVSAAARFILRFGFYPVHGAAAGARQPVHADDLAAAALLALDRNATAGRSYALGGGETLTYREMITRIFRALDRTPRIVGVPLLPAMLACAGTVLPGSELTADTARRMNANLDFDDGSAARDFGYAPRAFLSGGRADLTGRD